MVSFPDRSFDFNNVARLADWVEARCLFEEVGECSSGDLADLLHDSLMLQEEADRDTSHREVCELLAGEALSVIERRQRALRPAYPVETKEQVAQRLGSWTDAVCYSALLLRDVARFFSRGRSGIARDTQFPRLFEKIVQASLQALFGGASVRFGWPPDPNWPKPVGERIRRLADLLDLEANQPEAQTSPTDKDLGLDVAARLRHGDEGAGVGVLLTQCATGENWRAKKGEPALKEWHRLVEWRSELVRAVAFPWRRDDEKELARQAVRVEAIIFDRHRLMSRGNPDSLLDNWAVDELVTWCRSRISELE